MPPRLKNIKCVFIPLFIVKYEAIVESNPPDIKESISPCVPMGKPPSPMCLVVMILSWSLMSSRRIVTSGLCRSTPLADECASMYPPTVCSIFVEL